MMDVMDGADRSLVSIIVPVYRAERFLDVCVASLAGQTYRELDIILVDDASPDSCPALCDAWAARDGRIRVAHTSGGGASAARNVGLGMAQGDAVMFVDSDDVHAGDGQRRGHLREEVYRRERQRAADLGHRP